MKSPTAYTNKNKGFTLIELLVVIGILGVVFAIGALVNVNFYTRELSRAEQTDLLSVLQTARNRSMNNINAKPHGVYFNNTLDYYVLFEGTSYSSGSSTNEDVPINTNISTNASFDQVYFEQLSGNSSEIGIIAQTDSGTGRIKTVTLEANGLIIW